MQIDELVQYLGKLEELLEENALLKQALIQSESKVKDYRRAMKEVRATMDDHVANYRGAIRRQEAELHALYHKASTLLEEQKPENYDRLHSWEQRTVLQGLLDAVAPVDITFGKDGQRYTLMQYATKPYQDIVGNDAGYPEQALAFC